ncbi:MAG: hypothetical protein LBI28_00685 [Treponema sp.]|jgi:hypothetical protein|nr:hypothetical protein [Treponema sp.]
MSHKWIIFAFLLSLLLLPLFGQETQAASDSAVELPRQFRQISLGMSLDDLKTTLLNDNYFHFRGDRDVSLLPAREQSLVETTGSSFIRRAFFQLRDGEVFIMAFTLNTAIIDHYSVFMQFTEKYGEPSYLDPRMAVWETEETRIAIERPLTVKYIDKVVFNDIINESGLIESGHVRLRQDFLNEF